ncbi:sterol desaturase family protein [Winogradskyella sp. 3972H.M.0a.05]|uniref:NHL domain-containing protein n=1 Tax=Winogradskyella sp. 3972H.M.0a.05 TaxID=2950277 RepID=UPI00339AB64F
MISPLEILLDPISLAVLAMYAILMCWEAFFPAKELPKIKFWKLRGLASFAFFFYLSSYLPLFIDPYLESYRLVDLTNLTTLIGGLVGVVLYEFGVYVWHRTMHSFNFLWRVFHQMHHSAERLDTYGAFYFSPLDMVGWTVLGSLCFALLVGLSPQAITVTLLVTNFLGMFQHANIKTPVWLGYIIQRPESHTVHHAKGIHRYNYSDLPIFDILFGTFKNPKNYKYETGFYNGASAKVWQMLTFKDLNKKDAKKQKVMTTIKKTALVLVIGFTSLSCSENDSVIVSEEPLVVTVTTVSGNGQIGITEGSLNDARFNELSSIVKDAQGNLYVADTKNHRIRKITPDGIVSTFAGSTQGYADGIGTNAQFNSPWALAISSDGDIYVADRDNHRIRKITPEGEVSTKAGSSQGDADGVGIYANFNQPSGIAIDQHGYIYVSDTGNNKIRKIDPFNWITTLAGSDLGYADGNSSEAKFNNPHGITIGLDGFLYVADTDNHRIRKVDYHGEVTTFAGSTQGLHNGTLNEALFNHPMIVTEGGLGKLYIADHNYQVRLITEDGFVSSIAGSTNGFTDGIGNQAQFKEVNGIYVDSEGLYIADSGNHSIRRVTME